MYEKDLTPQNLGSLRRTGAFSSLLSIFVLLVGSLPALLDCRAATKGTAQTPSPATAGKISSPVAPETIGWVRLEREHPRQTRLLSVKPEDLPSHVAAIYRVIPDRRVLYAIAEIARIASPRDKATISLTFLNSAWKIRFDGTDVGTLPEISTYEDSKRMLLSWARKQKMPTSEAVASSLVAPDLAQVLDDGSGRQVIDALGRLDELWKMHPGQPELLAAATHGTISLLAQTLDELQLSDPIAGKALALLTLAQAAGVEGLQREEALLCGLLGYEAAALQLTETSPEDDAVRVFVTKDARSLRRLLKKVSGRRDQYLLLLALARTRDNPSWYSAFEATSWAKEIDLASLRLAMALDDFPVFPTLCSAMTTEAFLEAEESLPTASIAAQAWRRGAMTSYLEKAFEKSKGPLEAHLIKFEEVVRARAGQAHGPLLDGEAIQAFYLAPAYSAIHEMVRFLFDEFGDTDGAAKYLESFGETPAGTATELKRWLANRVAIRRNKANLLEVATETYSSKHIGLVPLSRVIVSVAVTVTSGTDPAVRTPMGLYFERLDARPGSLLQAADVFRSTLFNLPRAEKFTRAAMEIVPRSEGIVRWAYWSRDEAALRRIASDASLSVGMRSSALHDLRALGLADVPFLRERYRELMEEEPEDVRMMWNCAELLEQSGDLEGARKLIQRWSNARRDKDLTWVSAVATEARLLQRQGKLAAAWTVIQPVLPSWKFDALERGASILAEQGKLNEALKLARALVERYPEGGRGQAFVAEILWMLKRPGEAADAIRLGQGVNPQQWSGYARTAFARAFAAGHDQEAEVAFDALIAQKLEPRGLADLARSIGAAGNPSLAFRLLSKLKAPEPDGTSCKLWAYDELRKFEAEDKAVAWLRDGISANLGAHLFLFQTRRYELLWTLFPDDAPARVAKTDQFEFVRVVALLSMRKGSDPRREALISYFEGRPRVDFAVYSLYLLGKSDRKELFAQIKDLSYLTSIGWVIALKAASEGRYEEASDWFQVSLETGVNKIPPHAWSYELLRRWFDSGKLVSAIQAEGIL